MVSQPHSFPSSGPSRICLPLVKFSSATVSSAQSGPIPWVHISHKNDLFAIFEVTNVDSNATPSEKCYRMKVIQDPDVLEDINLNILGSEAKRAMEEALADNHPNSMLSVTVIVKCPRIAIRYQTINDMVRRFQICFSQEEHYYEAMKLLSRAQVPTNEAPAASRPARATIPNPTVSSTVDRSLPHPTRPSTASTVLHQGSHIDAHQFHSSRKNTGDQPRTVSNFPRSITVPTQNFQPRVSHISASDPISFPALSSYNTGQGNRNINIETEGEYGFGDDDFCEFSEVRRPSTAPIRPTNMNEGLLPPRELPYASSQSSVLRRDIQNTSNMVVPAWESAGVDTGGHLDTLCPINSTVTNHGEHELPSSSKKRKLDQALDTQVLLAQADSKLKRISSHRGLKENGTVKGANVSSSQRRRGLACTRCKGLHQKCEVSDSSRYSSCNTCKSLGLVCSRVGDNPKQHVDTAKGEQRTGSPKVPDSQSVRNTMQESVVHSSAIQATTPLATRISEPVSRPEDASNMFPKLHETTKDPQSTPRQSTPIDPVVPTKPNTPAVACHAADEEQHVQTVTDNRPEAECDLATSELEVQHESAPIESDQELTHSALALPDLEHLSEDEQHCIYREHIISAIHDDGFLRLCKTLESIWERNFVKF